MRILGRHGFVFLVDLLWAGRQGRCVCKVITLGLSVHQRQSAVQYRIRYTYAGTMNPSCYVIYLIL